MNILLIVIAFLFLFNLIHIKEGHINRLDIGDGRIPNVPHDAVCMILHAAGVNIDRMEYLKNRCTAPSNDLKEDSNICRV